MTYHCISHNQAPHGPFGCRVMAQQRKWLESHDTRSRDQLSRFFGRAVPLFDELFRGDLEAVVHAEDVDAEHALEVGRGEGEEGFDLGDACVGYPGGTRVNINGMERCGIGAAWA